MRAIYEGRGVSIKPEEAGVCGGRDRCAVEARAVVDRLMGCIQCGNRLCGSIAGVFRQRVAFGKEAVIDNPGLVVAQEGIFRRRVHQDGLDLGLGLVDVLTGEDAHTNVKNAPGRHRAGPVTALDLADIEIEG